MIGSINIVMPYYENKFMLMLQLATWESYPQSLKDKVRYVIVDDGSQNYPASEIIGSIDLPIKLLRVKKDIPWNQHGARNLGMKFAPGWSFLTDMDMVLTTENLEKVLQLPDRKGNFYTLDRLKMPDKEDKKYHCNSHVIHHDLFWKVNGYNTNYCGSYGGDGPFVRDLERQGGTRVHVHDIKAHWYGRSYLTDAGTNNYERTGFYKEEYRRRLSNPELARGWNPINFDWEEVKRQNMNKEGQNGTCD